MLQVRNERGTLVYSRIKSKEASEKIVYNTLTVPVRERFQLVLADGTKVFLNSGSEALSGEVRESQKGSFLKRRGMV